MLETNRPRVAVTTGGTTPKDVASMQDHLTHEEYWAAGFLEGEGCFRFDSGYVVIVTAQKEREPLDRLQAIIGGRIYIDTHRKTAKGNKTYLHLHKLAPQAEVEAVIERLYPLLSSRRQGQIDRAFALREKFRSGSGRAEANAKRAAYARERYHNDPEYRAKRLEDHKAWRKRKAKSSE
jgi:hypothetical protein